MSVTFKLRKDAEFHDGTPVTAKDVKWSFDRAVAVGGAAAFQMAAGSMQKPEQFVVVDDNTFRIDFVRKDKFTMPDFGVPTTAVFNSGLARKHATDKDPWAQDWLKNNEAGSGAYRVEKYTPGQELIYRRFDDWKSGPLPKIERVIWRVVPSAGNRRALLERGDVDISFDLPPKDVAEMATDKKLTVISTLIESTLVYLDMNVKMAPFDKVKVRQAVAYAIPYQKIMDAVMFGRGKRCSAARPRSPRPTGRSPARTPPILPRQNNCSPKPGCRMDSRLRCRSILVMPSSRNRCVNWSRKALPRSGSRSHSTRYPAPIGGPSSRKSSSRSLQTFSAPG